MKWDYKQILVHYYTGVDIIDDANGSKVAPDDRWNLLKYENIPSQMNPGQTIQANIWLQNTSTQPWADAVLGYQWIGPTDTSGWTEIPLSNLAAGIDENKTAVDITAPTSGTYTTLRLDVKRASSGVWFSEQTLPWPDVRIPISVNGPTATPTFAPGPTVTPTATPVITAYFHGPLGPYCVGGGCTAPTGYNNVLTPPTRNEQSMQANDPSAGLLGGGRVETKILVDGGGIGTLRMYYGLSGESCPAGNELQVSKVSGNVRYYNVPSTGYLDVDLAQVDGGGFIWAHFICVEGRPKKRVWGCTPHIRFSETFSLV